MADGATYVSCLEEEIVYVKFVSGGIPKTCYVGLAEVESAKAPGILKAIKSVMDKIDPEWTQKLISTGTDGAAVMMGRIGGVISLIKQDAPQVVGIHCVAHNLELAFSDTLKSNETMMNIKELLNGCWKHYKYSPKALRELREMAEAMEMKVGKPTKASGTRWVSHLLRALDVLLQKTFKQLFLTLSTQQKLEIQALENMQRQPGKHLASFKEEVGDATLFKGVSLTRNNTDDKLFEQSKAAVIIDTKQFLASRFEDFNSPVQKACTVISNYKSWRKDKNDLQWATKVVETVD